jgi:hypothetical protein
MTQHTQNITEEIVKKTCSFSYIFDHIDWAV